MEFFEFIPLVAKSRGGGEGGKFFPTLETVAALFFLIFKKEIDLPLNFLLFIKLHVLLHKILQGVVPKRMALLPPSPEASGGDTLPHTLTNILIKVIF